MSRATIKDRAARGALLLDAKYGRTKWARIVKLTRLDMGLGGFDPTPPGDDCGCVAAQLNAHTHQGYGSYSSEMTALFGGRYYGSEVRYATEKRNGFNVYNGETFEDLTDAWADEVRSRR